MQNTITIMEGFLSWVVTLFRVIEVVEPRNINSSLKQAVILYGLFVSTLFDICQLTNFADDNFCLESNSNLQTLTENVEKNFKWESGDIYE